MITTDNMYPNTARIYSAQFTGNADMPFDFFTGRYEEACVQESLAFVDCLINNKPSPCSGEDGLIALIMAMAAGKSAEEGRWVKFTEIAQTVVCDAEGCQVVELFDNKEEELAAAEELEAGGWEKQVTSKLD